MEERGDSGVANAAHDQPRWREIAGSEDFKRLETLRRRITVVLLTIFGVAFGAFLILCGYDRPFMSKSVDGGLTVAYVWLLALTVLAWVLVTVYLSLAEGRLLDLSTRVRERHGFDQKESVS